MFGNAFDYPSYIFSYLVPTNKCLLRLTTYFLFTEYFFSHIYFLLYYIYLHKLKALYTFTDLQLLYCDIDKVYFSMPKRDKSDQIV